MAKTGELTTAVKLSLKIREKPSRLKKSEYKVAHGKPRKNRIYTGTRPKELAAKVTL